MKRELTNLIRFILDFFLPPLLRDNKYFMYPMFYIWYKGKNVTKLMEFKKEIERITEEEYLNYYKIYDSVAKRKTDLNQKSLEFIWSNLEGNKTYRILDVGCGNGFVLSELKRRGYTNLTGCDIINSLEDNSITFVQCNIENLTFSENEFDIVLCNHTLEHVIFSQKASEEIKRVAKEKVIVTVPKQRYSRYTFDLHINFFPQKIDLISLMGFEDYSCVNSNGDWSFVGYK